MTGIDYKSRFKDADWVTEPLDIIIGGLGGIGNGIAMELGKLGHNLYIYEFDNVEYYNCIPQNYYIDQIGKSKFNAYKENLLRIEPKANVTCEGKYTRDSMSGEIMFSCFDNMQARRDMFNNWKENPDRKIFIDGRLLAEVFQLYIVLPGSEEKYEKTLFDDSETEQEPCTYKQTSHIAKLLHGYTMAMFCNWLVNNKYNMQVRAVPFKSVYYASINLWDYE